MKDEPEITQLLKKSILEGEGFDFAKRYDYSAVMNWVEKSDMDWLVFAMNEAYFTSIASTRSYFRRRKLAIVYTC